MSQNHKMSTATRLQLLKKIKYYRTSITEMLHFVRLEVVNTVSGQSVADS